MVNEPSMRQSILARVVPIAFTVVATVLLYLWLSADAAVEIEERLPLPANVPAISADEGRAVLLPGQPVKFDGVPADLPGAWPRFRGANFDAISTEEVRLARTWPQQGPRVLWSIDIGEGYAGPAVLAGRVYLLDYDHENQADVVRCLSLADGKDIWRYSYGIKVKRYHGMSRTIPAVTDKHVVTLGPKCHVTCLDSVTGEFRWMLDLAADFGATVPTWYAGQCPLIDEGKAIIAVGGDTLMMAVDCETGEIVWQSPNPHRWEMTHSSIMPAEFMGTRMYVYCASAGVVGISAKDGGILWETTEWRVSTANVPSPVVVGDGLIFLSGGYNAGSMMLRLTRDGDEIVAQPVFWFLFSVALEFQSDLDNGIVSNELQREFEQNETVLSQYLNVSAEEPGNRWLIADGLKKYSVRKEEQRLNIYGSRLGPEAFGSEQQTPIFYEGHIYGIRPDKRLVCLDLNGQVVWTSPSTHRFGPRGLGPYTIAQGMMYILDDTGMLTLAEATPSGYVPLAEAKVLDGIETWGPMAVASGRLILRDLNRMMCLDISEQQAGALSMK
jgi:outer membrane protein assembly factor BamB